jgi:protein-tyrosine phosphatase
MTSLWPATVPPPRNHGGPYRICLVCMGNICRSPMAEVVLAAELGRAGLGEAVEVDSAGTGDWHVGSKMDRRARAELARRGFDGDRHRARQFRSSWLADRDLVLAMDWYNLTDLRMMGAEHGRLWLLRSFDPASASDAEVPDPYNGEDASFGEALDLIEAATHGLTQQLAAVLA